MGWTSYGPRPAAASYRSALTVEATTAGAPTTDGHIDDRLHLSDVGKLARRARRKVVGAARADDQPSFAAMLSEHLGGRAEGLDVVEETWPTYDQVNVQAGLDAWLAEPGREHRLVGVVNFRHRDFDLSDLLRASPLGMPPGYGPSPGNVSRVNQASGPDGQVIACVQAGVYLVGEGDEALAMLLRAPDPDRGMGAVQLQIVAPRPELATRAAEQIRRLSLERNVYRGQVVSFGGDMFGERRAALRFHHRPSMTEHDLILPEHVLATIDRQVVGVAEHRDALLAARQHLKRGLLLYGPPGVGKTHTVRYLMSRLTDTTIVLLSGDALGLIGQACSVARSLQPAMIVVEDVDLIAEDRGMHPGRHPLLFSLLNEMDGLAEEADVVFLLTTNRADLLEPALASRPGRVDQAVELLHPDTEARRRLFALYRCELVVDESRLDSVIERTAGVTASFLKELLRRSAVLAASEGRPELEVSADHLDAALDELLDTRNAMTRVLLGGQPAFDPSSSRVPPAAET